MCTETNFLGKQLVITLSLAIKKTKDIYVDKCFLNVLFIKNINFDTVYILTPLDFQIKPATIILP
jgi:hypothetical protein